MAGRIGQRVVKPFQIGAHQLGVHVVAVDTGDEVICDAAAHLAFEITFEGQVDVTRREDQPAIAAGLSRKADDKPPRPVRQGAGAVRPSPDTDGGGAVHGHCQVGSGRRCDAHLCGVSAGGNGPAYDVPHRRVGAKPRQNIGMFVGNRHDSRAGLQDRRGLRRMHQTFDCQVDHKVAVLKLCQRRRLARQRGRGTGGANDRYAEARRLACHGQACRRNIHLGQRRLGKRDIHLPGQAFCQDCHLLVLPRPAHAEQFDKGGLPVRFKMLLRGGRGRRHRIRCPGPW